MKREEFFEVLSDIDEKMVANAKPEGQTVTPIIVTPKKKTYIKPICTAAACVALAAAVTAAALNTNRLPNLTPPSLSDKDPNSTPGEQGTAPYFTRVEVLNESSYPNPAYLTYPFNDDYTNVPIQYMCDLFPQALNDSKYTDYEGLAEDSSLIVMGTFTDDTYQATEENDVPDFEQAMVAGYFNKYMSFNTLKVEKVLKTDGQVYEGDEIVIAQSYAEAGGGLYSFSQLTPMIKGDKWVFFLNQYSDDYPEESYGKGAYHTVNDYEGRYPVPDSENKPFTHVENIKGVVAPAKFNESVYSELAEKLKGEGVGKRPPDVIESNAVISIGDEIGFNGYPSSVKLKFTMGEFEQLEFFYKNGQLNVRRSGDSEQEIQHVTGGVGFYINLEQMYLYDLNGDGKREICIQMSWGSGIVNELIQVVDIANNMLYTLNDRMDYDYSLCDEDNKLMVCKWEFNMNGSMYDTGSGERREPLSVKELTLDMLNYSYANPIDPELLYDSDSEIPLEYIHNVKVVDLNAFSSRRTIRVPDFIPDENNKYTELYFTIDDEMFFVEHVRQYEGHDFTGSLHSTVAVCEKVFGDDRNILCGNPSITDIYLCDLNGDGKREICCVNIVNEADLTDNGDVLPIYTMKVFDYANEKFYQFKDSESRDRVFFKLCEDVLTVCEYNEDYSASTENELTFDMLEEVQPEDGCL